MQLCQKAFSRAFNFSYIAIHLPASWREKIIDKCMEKTRLNVFQQSYIPQTWSIQSFAQYFNSAVNKLFRIYLLRKLIAVRFPYKHSKFGADVSIYPECNAWRHLLLASSFPGNSQGSLLRRQLPILNSLFGLAIPRVLSLTTVGKIVMTSLLSPNFPSF